MNSSNRFFLKEKYPSSMTGSVDNSENLKNQLAENQSKFNLNIKQKILTQGDSQSRTLQRNASQFVQDKLGRRYSKVSYLRGFIFNDFIKFCFKFY